MHLVDYIDPVLCLCRGEVGRLAQIPYIINAVIGGGVDLDYIQKIAGIEAFAYFAFAARVAVLRIQAVYGLGEDLCTGGFTGASGPVKR